MKDFPQARTGQPLTPALWNQARDFVRACRLLPGDGIRLRYTPDGTLISADAGAASWDHPFRVFLAGNSARILPGFLNGSIVPEIGKVPLTGTEKEPPPLLKWDKLKTDAEGRGFIALEVKLSQKWQIEKGAATVVQVARFDALEDGDSAQPDPTGATATGGVPILPGRIARWPLAMLRARKSGAVDLFQITHGDLQMRPQVRDKTAETGRAFFW